MLKRLSGRGSAGRKRLIGAALLASLLTSACATTTVGGCEAYGEARRDMPGLGSDSLSQWVADLDDRMTGACRG